MKVLAIDDQPEVLKQIEKALAAAEGPDGSPYEVVGMVDHEAALERLDAEHFDVVIADMVMGAQENEGLAILRALTDKSPITIVLTAYPSISNCVESMRAGAWDYIEKVPEDESDPYETLLRSVRQACEVRMAHPHAGRINPDSTWVRHHIGELMEEYGGEVVAVLDGKVVDHDAMYGALIDRVNERYPVTPPTIVSIPDPKVDAVE